MNSIVERLMRRARRRLISNNIVVAGLGRCGTTIVYQSVVRHGYRPTPFLIDMSECDWAPSAHAYKTHSYPPARIPSNVRVLFLFGDPLDIAVSTHQRINHWGRNHHTHLGSDLFRQNDDVLYRDSLRLAEAFDSWYRPHDFEFASIRYEDLWTAEVRQGLADYLGFELNLPVYRPRNANWKEHPLREELSTAYGDLAERVAQAVPFRRWQNASPVLKSDPP